MASLSVDLMMPEWPIGASWRNSWPATAEVQGRDRDGHLWAFLDEAGHPDAVATGNLVVTGDEEDPVGRVLDVLDRPGGRKVVMELIGDALGASGSLDPVRVVAPAAKNLRAQGYAIR